MLKRREKVSQSFKSYKLQLSLWWSCVCDLLIWKNLHLLCENFFFLHVIQITHHIYLIFLVGCLQRDKSHWQIFGSTVSIVSRAHERCSDSAGTRYSRMHISRESYIIRGGLFIASCLHNRKDQTAFYRRWRGECIHIHFTSIEVRCDVKDIVKSRAMLELRLLIINWYFH